MIPPSAIKDQNGPSGEYFTGTNMEFTFEIIDEANDSPANADYNCELFIDLNCDGNYAKTEKLNDIIIYQNGNIVSKDTSGTYHLKLKTQYTVSRKIPQEYLKLMPWKLAVVNNVNTEIRTSETGYTKRKAENAEHNTIRVLQIGPIKDCKWNLKEDTDFTKFFDKVKNDFNVQIEYITISKYEKEYSANCNYLDSYNMLIVGFCDGVAYGTVYGSSGGNFTEEGVKGILDFANTGKSVIFAHDNTSSSNYDRDAKDKTDNDKTWKGWAYYFNQSLQAVSGMDRYGITSSKTSELLKKAQNLDSGSEEWKSVQKNSYDMAYQYNTQKSKTFSETQGFSNAKLAVSLQGDPNTNVQITEKVSKINTGAITEYPYKIDSEFSVADTHYQYYQLSMEEDSDQDGSDDIVVWYCLGNGNGSDYYDSTPRDVRNNYYIYSYKNIIYTGVGHSKDFTTMEKKLFVNTIIAAYNAQAVNPNLTFVKESDWDAPEETSVYYMLDNMNFTSSSELITDSQEFHLKVSDSNLVGTSIEGTNTKDLKLEFFIESEKGNEMEEFDGMKLEKISLSVFLNETPLYNNNEGNIYVHSGNVYDIILSDLEKWLKDENGQYKGKLTLYAKISCEYLYYGEKREAKSVASIKLCQRQLFDLD